MRGLGHTRWRRFFGTFLVGFAMIVTLLVLMATGAIAVPITVSGVPFTVEADRLQGQNFTQFGAVDLVPGGDPIFVAVTELNEATITNLNQTICADLPGPLPAGQVTIQADEAIADSLIVDASDLTGDAVFTNIQIGIPVEGRDGTTVGQTADAVTITNLNQKAYYTAASTFTLNNLALRARFVGACA